MAHAEKANDAEPAARTVSIYDLEQHARELVRAVQASGEAVEIVEGGQVIARVSPTAGEASAGVRDAGHQARRDWLTLMDAVSGDMREVWPAGVLAQDVVNDIRREL